MTVSEFLNNSQIKKNDSKKLLQHVTGLTETDLILHPEKEISAEAQTKLDTLVKKRIEGIPVEYIIEKRNFYKDEFYVCEGVLIPQPDTEILVEEAAQIALNSHKKIFRILDLCAGSGCIGISVAKDVAAHFENFEVVFADISPIAIECCRKNAETLLGSIRYKIIQGDLFENLEDEMFDMVLSNPPYISSAVIPTLENDVQHEPMLALDGGATGLTIIERILDGLHSVLAKEGYILMEIGYDQGPAVSKLFSKTGLKEVSIIKDLGARNRVVKGLY